MAGAVSAIVMAAGKGTRMKSDRPKPLHEAAGRSILSWVLGAISQTGSERIVVVVGHNADEVVAHVQSTPQTIPVTFVEQRSQRGTGDAASVGLSGTPEDLDGTADVLVLPGDTPLLRPEILADFVRSHQESGAACSLLTADFADPTGLGRVIRSSTGSVERVVEQRDGTDEELAVTEVNTSVYCFRQSLLSPALRRLTPDNAQGEFYLTDVVGVLRDAGHPVEAFVLSDPTEALGVNDRAQLAEAEAQLRARINHSLLMRGVGMPDPSAVWVDADVVVGQDATLNPGTVLRGSTMIGSSAVIGPQTTLIDCEIGVGAHVPHTHGTAVSIADGADIAPFSVLT